MTRTWCPDRRSAESRSPWQGRESGDRDGGHLLVRGVDGHRRALGLGGDGVLREGATRDAVHVVAGPEASDAGADHLDPPCDVGAWHGVLAAQRRVRNEAGEASSWPRMRVASALPPNLRYARVAHDQVPYLAGPPSSFAVQLTDLYT
jgi:hypothetical protein